jgi:hypothetical protein
MDRRTSSVKEIPKRLASALAARYSCSVSRNRVRIITAPGESAQIDQKVARRSGSKASNNGLMANQKPLLSLILKSRASDNIRFDDLRRLLRDFGFAERIRGSHHIFSRAGIEEIINLQPKNGKAKVYQVRQVRALIRRYQLGTPNDK